MNSAKSINEIARISHKLLLSKIEHINERSLLDNYDSAQHK